MNPPILPTIKFGDTRMPKSFWRERKQDRYGCWIRKDGRATVQTIYRLAYEILTGIDIPQGWALDHLCFQSLDCSNPAHLEPVPVAENSKRGAAQNCRRHGWPEIDIERRYNDVVIAWRRSGEAIVTFPGHSMYSDDQFYTQEVIEFPELAAEKGN